VERHFLEFHLGRILSVIPENQQFYLIRFEPVEKAYLFDNYAFKGIACFGIGI
jgi:hypothetical protein